MPKKTREVWKLKEYNKCYCYERYGNVYTYVFGIKKSTPFAWTDESKSMALKLLRQRVEESLGVREKKKYLYDLIEDYDTNYIPSLSPESQRTTRYIITWLFDMDNFDLENSHSIRKAVLENINKRGFANSTYRKRLKIARSLFAYGIDSGYLATNPINRTMIPKEIKKEIECFEVYEVEEILRELKTKNLMKTYGAVLWSRYMATRINETLGIEWAHLDDKDVTFKRKGGHTQTLPYSKFPELKSYIDSLERTNGKVFDISSQKAGLQFKEAIFSINKKIEEKELKIEPIKTNLSFHAIRKMRENELIDKYPNDIQLVAEILDHSWEVMQAHYVKRMKSQKIRERLIHE